jgi:rhamnopyranosyl-N-acetylglucosaminyl-diphospho-decaprenol beta-1,3/1,4-galactofuranosyltransferase
MSGSMHVTAVVVTFNRRQLLERCLLALTHQTRPPESILVIDNASSDGTGDWLSGFLPGLSVPSSAFRLPENSGGAGGFCEGIRRACHAKAEWIWLMDDDAEPLPQALERLLAQPLSPENIYGSTPVFKGRTAWRINLLDEHRSTDDILALPARAKVESHPFLGFLIHRKLVELIGLPDASFFIAADDIEYCLRARRAGASIVLVSASRIQHPKAAYRTINLFGQSVIILSLVPWKRYYDTRNRILIARRYYGLRLLTHTIPGCLVRIFATLLYEPKKGMQLLAQIAGLVDGLLGLTGSRHRCWKLSQ